MFKLNMDCGANVPFELSEEQVAQLKSHDQVDAYIYFIGLKNILQDSHASVVRKDFKSDDEWTAAKRAKAELKLGALMNGEVRSRTAERKPKLSDEESFKRNFIIGELKKLFIAKHGKDSWKEKTESDTGAAFIESLLEKHGARYESAATEAWTAELAKRANTAKLAAEIDFDV